jgi:hypothetical protein
MVNVADDKLMMFICVCTLLLGMSITYVHYHDMYSAGTGLDAHMRP